jgi:hypothetical protein
LLFVSAEEAERFRLALASLNDRYSALEAKVL